MLDISPGEENVKLQHLNTFEDLGLNLFVDHFLHLKIGNCSSFLPHKSVMQIKLIKDCGVLKYCGNGSSDGVHSALMSASCQLSAILHSFLHPQHLLWVDNLIRWVFSDTALQLNHTVLKWMNTFRGI